jgi:hypothetical protein
MGVYVNFYVLLTFYEHTKHQKHQCPTVNVLNSRCEDSVENVLDMCMDVNWMCEEDVGRDVTSQERNKGVDTGGALGAEAPPDFQALNYIYWE